jgi:hypothetical protein
MKSLIILSLLFLSSIVYGQTDSIEKAVIYNEMVSGRIEKPEFSRIWARWNEVIKEIKTYPDLPLDQYGQIHYSILKEFPQFDQGMLFNKALEWLTIRHNLIPSYLYSNQADGKIIFRNSVGLNTGNSCTYACRISVKDGKILTEFINIGYETFFEGHYSDGEWVPERTLSFGIGQVYPIVLKRPTEWNVNLRLLRATNEMLENEDNSLNEYMIHFDQEW